MISSLHREERNLRKFKSQSDCIVTAICHQENREEGEIEIKFNYSTSS